MTPNIKTSKIEPNPSASRSLTRAKPIPATTAAIPSAIAMGIANPTAAVTRALPVAIKPPNRLAVPDFIANKAI